MMPYRLTRPDEFGSYWLGKRTMKEDEPAGPAIFPSKRLHHGGEVMRQGYFIVFLGSKQGFLFEGEVLKQFKSVEDALAEVNNLV